MLVENEMHVPISKYSINKLKQMLDVDGKQ